MSRKLTPEEENDAFERIDALRRALYLVRDLTRATEGLIPGSSSTTPHYLPILREATRSVLAAAFALHASAAEADDRYGDPLDRPAEPKDGPVEGR